MKRTNTAHPSSLRPSRVPELDPEFEAAVLWNRSYAAAAAADPASRDVTLALLKPSGACVHSPCRMLPDHPEHRERNQLFLERRVKFLLWQIGGSALYIHGCPEAVDSLRALYSEDGDRAFDAGMLGNRIYRRPFEVRGVDADGLPPARDPAKALGGHTDGCRIGFDLGGSDRKCAATIDGEVVFSEEVPWAPYFEKDPAYHLEGIRHSLKQAAAHLPRVDAIGGSAAGVYVDNEVRVASLFRGVSDADFDRHVRRMFLDLKSEWNDVPFDIVNDGEITALAGAHSLGTGSLLGVSMGTSEAAGYCDPKGRITSWLNELAFAPVDYRANGPVDEWSGDAGCGVQYFSQQGVARLARVAGYGFDENVPASEQLNAVQEELAREEARALAIYRTLGDCLGYTLAHYADFYDLRHVLLLGRVTSGDGGALLMSRARDVLDLDFPELSERLDLSMPDEKMKRHGQAVAAAGLPALDREGVLS